MDVQALAPGFGVEISGLDLSRPFGEETAHALRAAFADHRLLLLRGQRLDQAAQVRFATLFGPVSHRGAFMKEVDASHVSNARPDGILGSGVLHFHSDHTFFRHPLKAICLHAIEVPSRGGDTLFSDVLAAWDNLSDALKARIENLSSLQLFDYTGDYNRRTLERDAPADAPRCWHPLVRTDPDSGRKVLFAHMHTTASISGLGDDEAEALMEELAAVIADPAIGYRHVWKPGDLLLWNNIALQHARTDFDPAERRTLRRVPIAVSEAEAREATAQAA